MSKGRHVARVPVGDRETEADDRERWFRGRRSCPKRGEKVTKTHNQGKFVKS